MELPGYVYYRVLLILALNLTSFLSPESRKIRHTFQQIAFFASIEFPIIPQKNSMFDRILKGKKEMRCDNARVSS